MEEVEVVEKTETTSSIASSVMLKIPPQNMTILREDFQENRMGLDINEFIVSVISVMDLSDPQEMLLMAADLIDFFHLVDVNGDGVMEWEEFVMFILDAVVKEPESIKFENFEHKETRVVQSAAIRDTIVSAVMVPSLGKFIMGVGPVVQMFGTDDKIQPSNTHLVYKFPIMGANSNGETLRGVKKLTIVHMQYLEGQDVLAVLRSDMYIEFFKFLSRSNYSVETIESLGKLAMNKPCHKIAFRSSSHRKTRLLVIGTSPVIDSYLFVPMGSNGLASLSDHQTMTMHTDYVRDIITINSGPSRFIVSASLDKTVIFWDLDSMEYRYKRTGHTAGVESLAFGGKNLLFAGGFDYSILVWDITAAINKPLFVLKGGHMSSVIRIVGLENIERCASLDESGLLIWWDISRNNVGETRLIDTTICPEDHAHSFDIISDLPHFYEALHGVIFLAAGRRQHIFKLKDVSSHEAEPVCVLYSYNLLSVFTVHSHEIIFWNVVSGDGYKTVKELVGIHVKITCATLDDRGRRLIVGDSSGVVRYYNCLNGQQIKVLDSIGVPIKKLIYSPDKNLMIISENSDVVVVDDSMDISIPGVDYVLRSIHISDAPSLSDIVCVAYSYSLGLIASVDSFGLLIIWDYLFMTPEYMIANVSGNNSEVGSISFLDGFPILLISDKSKNFSILTLKTRSGSNKKHHLWRLESVPASSGDGDDDEEENNRTKNIGPRAAPYTRKMTTKYLSEECETKHMVIHVEEVDISEVDEESKVSSHATSEIVDSFTIQPKVVQSTFPKDLAVRVACGYGDGTLCTTNITEALRSINVGKCIEEDFVYEQLIYNPKGRCVKYIGESDCRKILSHEKVKSMEKFSTCTVECVKDCHRAPLTEVCLVGGLKWILTSSEDKCVMLWNIHGDYQGLLTRGSEMDKLFQKHWRNPEDLAARNVHRMAVATETMQDLDLELVTKERQARIKRKLLLDQGVNITSDTAILASRSRTGGHNNALTDPRDLVKALEPEVLGGSGVLPVNTDTITRSLRVIEKYPDRSRLLCQLEDKITYEPSKKDISRLQLQSSASAPQLGLGNSQPKKIKKKKKKMMSDGSTRLDQKYLRTIKIADDCLAQNTAERQKVDPARKLDKWHFANEIAEIDAKDAGNWEISSLNRMREMYRNMHHEMEKNGKISNDREKIILQKIKSLCPGGDVPAYFATLKSTYKARMLKKRFPRTIDVSASGKFDVFNVENGKLVEVSKGGNENSEYVEEDIAFKTEDYDEKFESKEGILNEDNDSEDVEKVKVVSLSEMMNIDVSMSCDDGEDIDENSTSSVQSDLSARRKTFQEKKASIAEIMKNQPALTPSPGKSRSIVPIMKRASSADTKKHGEMSPDKINMKSPSSKIQKAESKVRFHESPLSSAAPTPTMRQNASNTLLDPPDFIARQRTSDLLRDFESKMKETEKQARKASRQTRKKMRISRKKMKSNTATLVDSVRYLADPLELAESHAADFVKEDVNSKWGEKAKLLIQNSDATKKFKRPTLKRMPTIEDITRMLERTSSNISDSIQQQQAKEEQLMERKTFGPYVATELVQILELFKSFPKQIPGPEDTVLMAGKDPAEEMGDSHTVNPVYGCIDLADLIKHRWMRNRPHFKSFLDKLVLIQRPNMNGGLFITLSRIILQICPLITPKDRRDLAEYFKVYRGSDASSVVSKVRTFSNDHREQLKKVFDFFDKDKSGTIDKDEIREVLDETYLLRMKMHNELVGNEDDPEKNIDDNSIGTILTEAISKSSAAYIEDDDSPTMNFAAFLELFGQMLL